MSFQSAGGFRRKKGMTMTDPVLIHQFRSDLINAIRKFEANQRQDEIANAVRKIEADERRELLKERFDKLSPEDMEAALSYTKAGGTR